MYSAFFPALVYSILGTGRHCSVGPFAIVSGVMTGGVVQAVAGELGVKLDDFQHNQKPAVTTTVAPEEVSGGGIVPIDIAVMVTAVIGIYILILGICRLGFISIYLSEQFISGFSTSASIFVFTSQLRYLFGLRGKGHISD